MYYPTNGARVRVYGRVEDYAVSSADYVARIAEICANHNGSFVEESVPFSMLLESTDNAQSEASVHANRLAVVMQVLRSSEAHIHRGTVMIADIGDSISRTMSLIRASQELIYRSDLVIARTRTLDCE